MTLKRGRACVLISQSHAESPLRGGGGVVFGSTTARRAAARIAALREGKSAACNCRGMYKRARVCACVRI